MKEPKLPPHDVMVEITKNLIKDYTENGLSVIWLAKKYGMSVPLVTRILKANDISLNKHKGKTSKANQFDPSTLDRDALISDYVDNNLSFIRIAHKYNAPYHVVRKLIPSELYRGRGRKSYDIIKLED